MSIIKTSGGAYVDLTAMKDEDVDLQSISTALNNILRFSGHAGKRTALSVAVHSVLVADLAADGARRRHLGIEWERIARLAGIMHDFPEAFYGDTTSPVKRILGKAYRNMADTVDLAVYSALLTEAQHIDVSMMRDVVHEADLYAMHIERVAMWGEADRPDIWPDQVPDLRPYECEAMYRAYAERGHINLKHEFLTALERAYG